MILANGGCVGVRRKGVRGGTARSCSIMSPDKCVAKTSGALCANGLGALFHRKVECKAEAHYWARLRPISITDRRLSL